MSTTLIATLNHYLDGSGSDDEAIVTPIEGLYLMRSVAERLPRHVMYKPALCITIQGAKQVLFGNRLFDYGEMQALAISVELPGIGQVTHATKDKPYLGVILQLDLDLLRKVVRLINPRPKPNDAAGMGVFVLDINGPLASCIERLIQLLTMPEAIPAIYPAIMQEITYWLLTGPSAGEISKLTSPNGYTQRIANTITFLHNDIARPVRIEDLAERAQMSPSAYYQHFKSLTSLTPIQYLKQLRLLEARRLMVAEGANVTSAAYQVGYESISQFSREYSRMFGASPKRDVAELQVAVE
ncbi:AraC family transcriptional regulator [Paraburkholderia caribensis]|uniref:AraC family transcriptional regulator n=1 Tax=Paraburkholderia caribensis TaxID=75105 RepID=UPI001CB5A046|nr:AraC family transcriptional regulator [Paraburkholderia caribensis]CAG9243770.1 Transcriptional regulator, AraC family [Paraburkholderia caribensis]